MSNTTDEIIEKLKSITLLEATELVTGIEQTFGVDASFSLGGGAVPMTGEAFENKKVKQEKTSFNVILQDIASDKRVPVLKVIRDLTSLGLKEAKEFTTELPKTVRESVSKKEAETAQQQLEQAGATVKVE